MQNIKIVSGLNYGDESKGLVTNAVSTPTCLNIMPSNSCQRGHTVVQNGIRRVFRHFGSGTLKGAATYFSGKFMVNPAMFRIEWKELEEMGIKPVVYARTGGIIVSPIDMFANVNVEQRRGDKSHSSTGCGVWEAYCRNEAMLKLGLGNGATFEDVIRYYSNVLKNKDGSLPQDVKEFLYGNYLKENFINDFEFFYNHITLIKNDKEEKELLNSYPLLVFENGQGLLLADDYSYDIEHNTPAYVGARVPAEIIKRNFAAKDVSIECLYASRTYLTRHGKGRIGIAENCECAKEDINPTMFDKTNVPNESQGSLRYGKFNQNEAKSAITRATADTSYLTHEGYSATTSLVATHCNEFNDNILLDAAAGQVDIYISNDETNIERLKN